MTNNFETRKKLYHWPFIVSSLLLICMNNIASMLESIQNAHTSAVHDLQMWDQYDINVGPGILSRTSLLFHFVLFSNALL